jgi:hypothetical protein
LDHICCVVEHELEAGGDFERFYPLVVSRFYKTALREIEDETVHLLTNKHYYKMKKTMLYSGALSVGLLSAGIVLKFLHLPGAAVLIVLGTFFLSFVFLPLMFALRMKEKQGNRPIVATGSLAAMLISVGVLFKIMHWPGANILCLSALLVMIFAFIPVYFFSGIRHPETKTNTVVSSILMFTGCLLILTLIRAPHGTRNDYIAQTRAFAINDQTVRHEKRLADAAARKDALTDEIYAGCEELKTFLLKAETGQVQIGDDFESRNALIGDSWAGDYFSGDAGQMKKVDALKEKVDRYNQSQTAGLYKLDTTIFRLEQRIQPTLMGLNQIQLTVLQNRRGLVAMK